MKGYKMSTTNKLLRQQLDSFFKKEKRDIQELLYQISLLVFKINLPDTHLYELYKNEKIDRDTLDELINYFDGAPVRLPSKKEWKKCLLLAITYYMKYFQLKDWDDIKKELNINEKEMNSSTTISLGLDQKIMNGIIYRELQDMVNSIDSKKVGKSFKEIFSKIEDDVDDE
jgi:hypothetical protein